MLVLRMLLPGEVLELRDARVRDVLVGIVDHRRLLETPPGSSVSCLNSSERYGSFPKR